MYKEIIKLKKGDWSFGFLIERDKNWSNDFTISIDLIKFRILLIRSYVE